MAEQFQLYVAVRLTDGLLLNSLPLMPQATPAVLLLPPPPVAVTGVTATTADANDVPTAFIATTVQV